MPIGKKVKLGKNVQIYHKNLVNLFGCTIGDECNIGRFVEIQAGVVVGDRVKIQPYAFIPEGVTLEDEVFVGPHVVFTNDLFPRSTNPDGSKQTSEDWIITETLVKKRASIGANATILCGVTIGEGAMIGAGSMVLHDVPPWTVVADNPAREIRKLKKGES